MQRKFSISTTSRSSPVRFGVLVFFGLLGVQPGSAWAAKPLPALLDPNLIAGKYPYESGILDTPEIDLRLRKLMKQDFRKLGPGLEVQGDLTHERAGTGEYLVVSGNKTHAGFDLRVIVAFDLSRDKISVGVCEELHVTRYFEHMGGRRVVGRKAVFPFETDLSPWWRMLRIRI